MTQRARRGWTGLSLILLSFVYPVVLWVKAPSEAESEPLNTPLLSQVTLPASLKQGRWYIFQIVVKTSVAAKTDSGTGKSDVIGAKKSSDVPRSSGAGPDSSTQRGQIGCMLQAPDPNGEAAPYQKGGPCAGAPGPLRFHYRLLDAAGQVVRGDYGAPVEGEYGDRSRYFDVGEGDTEFDAEFASLHAERTGMYTFEISRLQMPAALLGASPQLEMYAHVSDFAFLDALPGLLLSALLFFAGLVVLLVAAFTRRRDQAVRGPR